MIFMPSIAENIEKIKKQSAGITLLAVVKNVATENIFEALESGITVIGENKIQEARARYLTIRQKYPDVKIHMIGHLQSNKINQALEMFDVIESVDSYELAVAIDKRAQKPIEIFIEVNTTGEPSKFGVSPDETLPLIEKITKLKNLKLTGLMTIGLLTDDPEKVRPCFKKLRELRDFANKKGYTGVRHLSMGMSHDFSVAIEEGSDIIRVGTAIFGKRGK